MPDANENALPEAPPTLTPRPKRFGWLFPMLRVVLVIAAGVLAWYVAGHWNRWTGAVRYESTGDAYTAGDVTPLAAKVSGYVADVAVADYQIGLLLSGGLITFAFVTRELWTPRPFLNLGRLLRGNVLLLLLLLAGFRFIILSTAYIIPTYLLGVQNFRELQVGSVLLWIALPQLVIAFPLANLLRQIDGRWALALGSALIGIACWMATQLTSEWATVDFRPSQILQAIGQSFALTALLALIIRSINPADALAIGCLLQIGRLFGGEVGTAFMQTFVRVAHCSGAVSAMPPRCWQATRRTSCSADLTYDRA